MAGDADNEWFATNNGIFALDLEPKPFRVLQHDPDDANSLAANEIDAIYEDPQGILWVATASTGLNRIDRGTGQVSHFQHDPADPASVSATRSGKSRLLAMGNFGWLPSAAAWISSIPRPARPSTTGTIRTNRPAWARIGRPPSWRISPAASGSAPGMPGWIASTLPRVHSPILRMIRPTRRV